MPTDVTVFGAGGHAKVVLDAVERGGDRVVRLLDGDPRKAGLLLLDRYEVQDADDAEREGPVHVAIGDNLARARVAEGMRERGGRLYTVRHPDAIVAAAARIGDGCFLAAGSVVGPDAALGEGVIVNHHAVVDHDCIVEAWCHIAPGAILGGGVSIGAGSLIGSGTVVLPGLRIGAGVTVGAGAVVTRSLPDGVTVAGVPARLKETGA